MASNNLIAHRLVKTKAAWIAITFFVSFFCSKQLLKANAMLELAVAQSNQQLVVIDGSNILISDCLTHVKATSK